MNLLTSICLSLIWLFVGHITAEPAVELANDIYQREWCGGYDALEKGKALLKGAILEQGQEPRFALFKQADAVLLKAERCGVAKAAALRGVMLCKGWGMKPDRKRGRRAIWDAIEADSRIGYEFSDSELCPVVPDN